MTDEQIERVRTLTAKGFSTKEIAKVTGLLSREVHRVRTGKTLHQTCPILELRQERPPSVPVHEWERLILMNFADLMGAV